MLCQLLREVAVEDGLDGEGDDDFVGFSEVGVDFGEGVRGEVEGDEEALGAVLAGHDGLEGVDVGAAGFVLLFDLDRVPGVHEVQFAGLLFGDGGDGVDAAVNAPIADLGLVGDAADGDDGPVFELERRQLTQLFDAPGQVADDKAPAGTPEGLIFANLADIAEPLGHDAAGRRGEIRLHSRR
jgi:hypothetical protein